MKRLDVVIVMVVTVSLTLGAVWGFDKYQKSNNPQLYVQAESASIMSQLEDIQRDLDDLYRYQVRKKIKVKKHVAVIVPEDMLNQKPKTRPGAPAVTRNTSGK